MAAALPSAAGWRVLHNVGKPARSLPRAGGRIRAKLSRAATDAFAIFAAGSSRRTNDDAHGARRDYVSRRIAARRQALMEEAVAQANGMFSLIRCVSVESTTADFAMCRLRLALFDESR